MQMTVRGTNCESRNALPAIFARFPTGEKHTSLKTGRVSWFRAEPSGVPLLNFENYVGMELSLVPEVEAVFVKCDNENGNGYTIFTVINDRDPDVRARVYAREQAIMDTAKGIDFSFRVISRMNRNLSDIIDKVGKLAFRR